MNRTCSGLFVFVLLVLVVALATKAVSEECIVGLAVTDVLTFPSKDVELQARLTMLQPEGEQGIAEEPIEFFVQERLIGRATTDAQGWARLLFTPKMRGNLALRARWATASKADVVEGHGIVLSWERRRPILLIDLIVLLEHELNMTLPPPELFSDPGLVLGTPHPLAAAELGKLAQYYYNLVYLDRTGKGQVDRIQSWIREQAFPPGMIRILPQTSTALADLLQSLEEEGWDNVSGGIGRTADFAEVLVKNRLQTIILPLPDNEERFPRRAVILNDWSRVRRHL